MNFVKSLSTSKRSSVVTVIGIDRDRNSQFAVKWAVDNLVNDDKSECIIVHVRSQHSPRDSAADTRGVGREPTKQEFQQYFLPYRGCCARKGIKAKEVVVHDIDVPSALIYYAINNSARNIVVGASNRNLLLRKLKGLDVPSGLIKFAPEACSIYVISSRGRIENTKSAIQPQTSTDEGNIERHQPMREFFNHHQPDSPKSNKISRSKLSHDSWGTEESFFSIDPLQTYPNARARSKSTHAKVSPDKNKVDFSNKISVSDRSNNSGPFSLQAQAEDHSSVSSNSWMCSPTGSPGGLEAQIRRLRLELKQSMDTYNSVCRDSVTAKGKALETQQLMLEETHKIDEAKLLEETALALVERERQKTKAAKEEAQMAHYLADMEAQKREIAEMKAKYEAEERERAIEALAQNNFMYRKYTIQDIETATNCFSSTQKIGEGAYGPVYKGILDHTDVAIKVLRPDISQGHKQFHQEVEVLSCIRHPNMVLLLGACPEYGCLVYEYMENGSLEDRLFHKGNTPSIPWRTRFKIAAEIATGLLFLHQNKPEPLVHRDLKPANILLDRNYMSKISDVGLARLVPPPAADSITQYRMTAAAGTFCYIDPEYQQTGMLGVKSDLYSFGVMLLQIITAKPPIGLGHHIENAIENGTLLEILDPTVNDWPIEETLSFAKLALKCCELRRRDRPELASVVLPELIRLRDFGLKTAASNNNQIIVKPDPYHLAPQETVSANQINMRRGLKLPRSMTRIWGCGTPREKARHLPPRGKQIGKPDKLQPECVLMLESCSPSAAN